MKIKVNKHNLELIETPVNELEVNVTKIEFEFDEDMQDMVKEAYFTLNDHSYKVIIENNECNIPSEVLTQKGNVEIGVVCFEVQDEETIKRYNPSPVYISTWSGSLKEADNTEPITPTDKEQIEQMLSNINIDGNKSGEITTITITYKDGTTKELQLEDGKSIEYNWQGTQLGIRQEGQSEYVYVDLKGEPGVPGAVKFIIVQTLPTEDIQTDAIYLVPSDDPTTQDLYLEYMYINNQWELLGQKQIVVDLTDYVKFTDTAGPDKAGVMKVTNGGSGFIITNGFLRGYSHNYQTYVNAGNDFNIAKGTLEGVIAGKGLVSNIDYAGTSVGGTIKIAGWARTGIDNGVLTAVTTDYATYLGTTNSAFISKGTLEAVLTARIGDIASVIDAINGESI